MCAIELVTCSLATSRAGFPACLFPQRLPTWGSFVTHSCSRANLASHSFRSALSIPEEPLHGRALHQHTDPRSFLLAHRSRCRDWNVAGQAYGGQEEPPTPQRGCGSRGRSHNQKEQILLHSQAERWHLLHSIFQTMPRCCGENRAGSQSRCAHQGHLGSGHRRLASSPTHHLYSVLKRPRLHDRPRPLPARTEMMT